MDEIKAGPACAPEIAPRAGLCPLPLSLRCVATGVGARAAVAGSQLQAGAAGSWARSLSRQLALCRAGGERGPGCRPRAPGAEPRPWQVTVEDFEVVCQGLYRALCIREKYMRRSLQRFPRTPAQYLRTIEGEVWTADQSCGPGSPRPCAQGTGVGQEARRELQPGPGRRVAPGGLFQSRRLLSPRVPEEPLPRPMEPAEARGATGRWGWQPGAGTVPGLTALRSGAVFNPPVKEGEDPFQSDNLPEDLGYHVQMQDGVAYVYADVAAPGRGQPKDLPYPDLEGFINDMNFLLALIAQGPV